MDKLLYLFILLCSLLLEVRCLQCYVCDNCAKVKEEQLQTCGMPTTPGPSTTITTTTQATSPSTTTLTTFTSTKIEPITIPTKTTAEPTTISTTISTELRNTSTTTTEANIIPTITTAKTNTDTTSALKPPTISTTITMESKTSSVAITTSNITSSTTTTEPTKITSKPETIYTKSTTEPIITTTELKTISAATTTEPLTNSTIIISEPTINHSDTVINYLTTTEPTPTTLPTIPFISTLPATTAEPAESTTHMTAPIYITMYPESTNFTKSVEVRNATYNFPPRRSRSLRENCACSHEKTCDCPTSRSRQRSKRYALRGLAFSKNVKYVCVVDKFQENENEVVKRGCAIMDEGEDAACVHGGFGADCKICDSDKCNGASIPQTSAVFMLIIFCIQYFNVLY